MVAVVDTNGGRFLRYGKTSKIKNAPTAVKTLVIEPISKTVFSLVLFDALESRHMSAIVTFYIFDKSALESLANKPSATPQKAGLLKSLFGSKEPSPQKLFADEFYAVGKEVAVFEYSGYAFPHLELFLEERFSIEVNSHVEADLTRRLEENVGPCQAFEAAGAAELLQRLSSITVNRTDLQEYADDEFGDDQGEMVAALESAFNSLKSWLAQVHTGQIGVLING